MTESQRARPYAPRCGPSAGRSRNKMAFAVPVAPTSALQDLREEADEIICLEDDEIFGAIGFYYADLGQLSDGPE
jgi:predicted phosphoribosyltransferase